MEPLNKWAYRLVQLPADMELPGLANWSRRWFWRERQGVCPAAREFLSGRQQGVIRFVRDAGEDGGRA